MSAAGAADPMSGDPLVLLAEVLGSHGVRGLVRLRCHTAVPEDVAAYGPLEDRDGRRFRVTVKGRHKGGVLAGIDGIAARDAADALRGVALHVRRSALPPPDDEEFYLADLIGLAAVLPDGSRWGAVRAVHNFGAGDVLELAPAAGGPTALVPFSRDAVPTVDLAGGRVVLAAAPDEAAANDDDEDDEAVGDATAD